MKNQLLIAMMVMASLLFIATGANAQGCSGSYQWDPYFRPAGSSDEACIPGLAPAGSAAQESKGEMVPAGAAAVTGEQDVRENAQHFGTGREYCGYCSIYERGGFP
jgi:hypothetical protein